MLLALRSDPKIIVRDRFASLAKELFELPINNSGV